MFFDSESEFEDDFSFINKYLLTERTRKRAKKNRYWVHEVNRKREIVGEYYSLVVKQLEYDENRFFMYLRMSKVQLAKIHRIIEYDIKKEHLIL